MLMTVRTFLWRFKMLTNLCTLRPAPFLRPFFPANSQHFQNKVTRPLQVLIMPKCIQPLKTAFSKIAAFGRQHFPFTYFFRVVVNFFNQVSHIFISITSKKPRISKHYKHFKITRPLLITKIYKLSRTAQESKTIDN